MIACAVPGGGAGRAGVHSVIAAASAPDPERGEADNQGERASQSPEQLEHHRRRRRERGGGAEVRGLCPV